MSDGAVGRRIDSVVMAEIWASLHATMHTRRVRKRDSILMRIIARILAVAGVMRADQFLDGFVTTVRRTIYVPDRKSPKHDLHWEVAMATHEHDHVRKWGWKYIWRYLTSSRWRAVYEAEAYCTNIALRRWYKGDWLDVKDLAAKLATHYGCSQGDVAVAYRIMEEERDRLRRGEIANPVVQHVLVVAISQGIHPAANWTDASV